MEWTIAETRQMKGIGTHAALVCHLKQYSADLSTCFNYLFKIT